MDRFLTILFIIAILVLIYTPQNCFSQGTIYLEYSFYVESDSITTNFVVILSSKYTGAGYVYSVEKIRVYEFNLYTYIPSHSFKKLVEETITSIIEACMNDTSIYDKKPPGKAISTNYFPLLNHIVYVRGYSIRDGVEYRDAHRGLLIAFSRKIHVIIESMGKKYNLGEAVVYAQLVDIEPSGYTRELSIVEPETNRIHAYTTPVILIVLALATTTILRWNQLMI